MHTTRFISGAALAAMLAGCAGGGSGPAPSASFATATAPQSAARGTLVARIDTAKLTASLARSVKQITSYVDTVGYSLDNGATVTLALNSTNCPSSVCTISPVTAGSHTVKVTVLHGTTEIGTSVMQTVTITAGATTSADFTITPEPVTITVTPSVVRMPEDGVTQTATMNVAVADAGGLAISSPIDHNVFGTVGLTTSYTATGGGLSATSAVPATSTATNATTHNTYASDTFSFAPTFTYLGGSVIGDEITFNSSYTSATGYTFSPTLGGAQIFLARVALPAANSTPIGNGTYDGAGHLNFTAAGTYTGFLVTEINAGNATTGSTTSGPSTLNFADDTTHPCSTNGVTVTAGTQATSGNNISNTYSIAVASGAQSCIVHFTTSDWGASSIHGDLNVVPPGTLALTLH